MRSVRRCAGALVAAGVLLAAQLVTSVVAHAAGGPPPLGEYLACGYNGSSPNPPASCQSLPNALAAALSYDSLSAGTATIVLMPGTYCPFTISDSRYSGGQVFRPLIIEGGGASASDSMIKWSATYCSGTQPSGLITVPNYYSDSNGLQLRDLTVEGSASGGPTTGLDIGSASVIMRDVLVEHNTQYGINYHPATNQWGMAIYNSALLHNGYGFYCGCLRSDIIGSTIADNTYGLFVSAQLGLMSDTITHNTTGVDITNSSSSISTVNTIVGSNTSNCTGYSIETAGQTSSTNLLASDCNPQSANHDITLTNSIGDVSTSTQPTPSVAPPAQAIAKADSFCADSTFHGDQLEHLQPSFTSCDIGSVDTQATTATPSASGLVEYESQQDQVELGDVPIGQTSGGVVEVSNSGGGLLTITGASVSGARLSIESDACTYLAVIDNAYCFVVVGVTPTALGPVSGTLTVTTNGGTLQIPVSATGIAALAAPPGTTMVAAGYQHATLSWTASPSASVHATPDLNVTYEIDQSTNGGAWQQISNYLTTTSQDVYLEDGKSYRFRVCTEDNYTSSTAPGPCTPPTAAVKSQPNASALSHPASSTISYGSSTHATTTLTDTSTHAHLAGKPITLWSRKGTSGAFSKVTQLTTSAAGTASVIVKPLGKTQYQWRFTGAGIYGSVSSAVWTVSVAPTVAAKLQHTKVRHGKSAEVYGTVTPAAAHQTVKLQYKHAGKWVTLGSAKTKLQTLPNHKHVIGYVITHTFTQPKKYSLRIVRPATSALSQARSKTLALKVT